MGLTVASYCDHYYYKYILVLMKGVAMFLPEAHPYCLLINCDANHEKCLRKVCPKIEIEHEHVRFDNSHVHKSYIYRRRVKLWHRLVNERKGCVFCPDADSIIRKPCVGLVEHLASCDLTMRVKDYSPNFLSKAKVSFAGSTVGFKCNPIGQRFMDAYVRENDCDYRKMATMKVLSKAFYAVRDLACTLKHLPREYCSPWHGDGDILWEGNGAKKQTPEWAKESKRILAL